MLLEAGADPNHESLLSRAVTRNRADLVECLLANGSDPNRLDGSGEMPLHWAVQYGYPEIAALLLENGARVNARNTRRQTPLAYVKRDMKDIKELLLRYGATR
jgi:ankyrin repeat protein